MISYNFKNGPLDKLLDDLVGNSREAQTIRKIREDSPEIEGREFGNSQKTFTDNGIYTIANGKTLRSYIYLQSYKIKTYESFPKRHYFHCEVAQKNYPWFLANKELVTIFCSETGTVHPNIALEVCGYCLHKFQNLVSSHFTGQSIEDFVLELENQEATKTKTTGVDGYVTNWTEISTAYRRKKDFTCEKCRIKDIEGMYMHTHHINGTKSDNRTINLQCLCIRCHADVDDRHRRNFATITQQRLIRRFKEKNGLISI